MAVRRSARLRSRQASNEPQPPASPVNNTTTTTNNNNNNNKLPSVMERDETPADGPSNHTTTPKSTTSVRTPHKAPPTRKQSPTKTPTSTVARPSHQDMHPSKAHQSTTKQADSGLILGFNPLKKDAEGNIMKDLLVENTPSKSKASPASTYYGTPGFEFKFSCADSQLSDEAKKLMESVREDVAKIKAQMVQDKESQPTDNNNNQTEDRRIAQPKGKASRFSSAHMAEFKKMDSIAGHASAFRATPGRFQPVQKLLKRTNSKARLDEASNPSSPTKSTTKSPTPASNGAKRTKFDKNDDASTRRPTTGEKSASRPGVTRIRSAVRSSLMTPTRSSMARVSTTSLKPPRTTMLPRPSMTHSSISKSPSAPRTPRTDFNPRFKSSLPTLNLKSILRPHQPLFSKDPLKIAAGTHTAAPDFCSNLLLGASPDASVEPVQTPSPRKRVEFSPSTRSRDDVALPSPSPSKIQAASPSRPLSDIVYPTLPALTPDHTSKSSSEIKSPTIRHIRPSDATPNPNLPDISGVPHGIGSKKRHRETEANNDPSLPDVPGVPHGINNKKRHRDAAGREADTENVPPVDTPAEVRSAKRVKLSSPSKKMPSPSPIKVRSHTPSRSTFSTSRTGTPASARQKSRGALSISRLNMLAQPKSRS
ncbi:hypothetical protein BBP40_005681 [Aspergillus hancockii]|nr:hypothetical protein BBP40_005681 [Aspergillus hancockii]